MLRGEIVHVVLEVLVSSRLLDSEVLRLDETVQEVALLTVLLLVIDSLVLPVGVGSLNPGGDAELSLDAQLGRLLLLLLWSGGLGTWCGAGGGSWGGNYYPTLLE